MAQACLCLVEFWKRCTDLEEKYTNSVAASLQKDVVLPARIAAPAKPAIERGVDHASIVVPPRVVAINFAGVITRESITSLNDSLRKGGWRMDSKSGRRTQDAAGRNELLYSRPKDADAARSLAGAVTQTRIGASPIQVRQDANVPDDALQLWISK